MTTDEKRRTLALINAIEELVDIMIPQPNARRAGLIWQHLTELHDILRNTSAPPPGAIGQG